MNLNPLSCSISSDRTQPVYTSQSPNDYSEITLFALEVFGTFAMIGALYVYGRWTSSAERLPWFNLAWEGDFDAKHTGQGKRISPFGGVWSGTFVNGNLHGKGKIDDSVCVQEGEFEHDRLVKGTCFYKDDNRIEYVYRRIINSDQVS